MDYAVALRAHAGPKGGQGTNESRHRFLMCKLAAGWLAVLHVHLAVGMSVQLHICG
jgi:hypothetical protein